MPPKDFSMGYLDWERRQEQKREQQKRDAKRNGEKLQKSYGGTRRINTGFNVVKN
jgi:hypothetical protein